MALEIDLSGRVALVTGGSRGLGRADALTLASAGADVAVLDIEDSTATAADVEELGPRALAIRCDVADHEQVRAAVERVVAELGSAEILVANAATLDHLGQLPDQSREL